MKLSRYISNFLRVPAQSSKQRCVYQRFQCESILYNSSKSCTENAVVMPIQRLRVPPDRRCQQVDGRRRTFFDLDVRVGIEEDVDPNKVLPKMIFASSSGRFTISALLTFPDVRPASRRRRRTCRRRSPGAVPCTRRRRRAGRNGATTAIRQSSRRRFTRCTLSGNCIRSCAVPVLIGCLGSNNHFLTDR